MDGWARLVEVVGARVEAGCGLFTLSQPLPLLLVQLPDVSLLYTVPSLPAYKSPDLLFATAPCP